MPFNQLARFALATMLASFLFSVATSSMPIRVSAKNPRFGYGADSEAYWDHAYNLSTRHGFMSSPGHGFDLLARVDETTYETQRLPGYPLLLALVRWLAPAAGPRSWPFILLNLSLVFVNGWFILSIVRRDILCCSEGQRLPRWTCTLVATYLPFLIYGDGIDSDFLVATLLAGMTYAFFSPGKPRHLAVLFATWAAMTRVGAIVYIVPFLALTLLQKPDRGRRFKAALVIMVSIGSCLSLWSYRNYRLSGYFRPEFMSGLVLQQNYLVSMQDESAPANFEDFARWNSEDFREKCFRELAAKNGYYAAAGQMDAEMKAAAKAVVLKHPTRALKTALYNLAALLLRDYFVFEPYFISPTPLNCFVRIALFTIFYVVPTLVFLAVVSALALRRSWTIPCILGCSALCYLLITAAVWGMNARYALPIAFILVIMNILGIDSLAKRWQRLPPRPGRPATA